MKEELRLIFTVIEYAVSLTCILYVLALLVALFLLDTPIPVYDSSKLTLTIEIGFVLFGLTCFLVKMSKYLLKSGYGFAELKLKSQIKVIIPLFTFFSFLIVRWLTMQ